MNVCQVIVTVQTRHSQNFSAASQLLLLIAWR